MNIEQAVKWLDAIKEKYIHGGDDEMDAKRKEAIDMAIRSLEAWVELKSELMNPQYTCGIGRNTVLVFIEKALGEVGENNDSNDTLQSK